ncbi:MAG TPA: hypothetical protein VFU63_05975, partial [Ktedonobacterales bacterium]|nr:hypothetical protein [Ktedonobacterales bacterium]
MNNHRPHEPAPSTICSRMELILPVLEDGELDATTMATALDHLRTCAHCQRERERYVALDEALRERFGFSSARLHTTEEILQHINKQDQSTEYTATGASAAPSHSDPGRFARFSHKRPWLSGLGAVAVVVVLLGMAALLFGGRFGQGVGSHGGPPRYTFTETHGIFADVSMVSPEEGWALAQVTKGQQGSSASSQNLEGTLPNTVTFYHYLSGAWTPVTLTLSAQAARTLGAGGPGGFNGTISMDSASDGWAVASDFNRGSVLFHFTSGKWQEVPSQDLSTI